jgi:regulatory protein SWI5
MLSNPPPSGLQNRQRQQHRRQNSTPTAFETMEIANSLPTLPPHQQPRPQQGRPRVSHRRGMSLDTRRQQIQSPTFRQEFHQTVSEHTNTGHNTQHVLREAQQQRIARPGPQQAYANLASDENYLISPHATPQMQGFEGQCFDGLPASQPMNMPFDMYNGQLNTMMKKNPEGFSHGMPASQDFELFPNSAISTPTFMNFSESAAGAAAWMSEGEGSDSRRSSRRISNGIMDRVSKFENMGTEGPQQKPITPPNQNANGKFHPRRHVFRADS